MPSNGSRGRASPELLHETGVFAHEITHSTGNSNPLNHDMSGRFGSEKYAFEELAAELLLRIHADTKWRARL